MRTSRKIVSQSTMKIMNICRKKAGCLIPCFLCLCASGRGRGRGSRADPTPPTRHPDTPTRKGRCRGCNPMQADAKGEKPMQADARGCKRKSKEAGGRGSGQGAKGALTSPKGAKSKDIGAISVVSCCVVVFCANAFLRFWLGCAPLPL